MENDKKNISPVEQIKWLTAMMSVDRNINQNELNIIVNYGMQLGLDKERIKRIVSISIEEKNNLFRYLKLVKINKNVDLMRALIKVVFADGKVAQEELAMIKLVAQKMEFPEEELKQLLEDEKKTFMASHSQAQPQSQPQPQPQP
jgi:uncharacterized tellurite resistance protein B-like protein